MFIMGKVILTSVFAYMCCQHVLADLTCSSQKNKSTIPVGTVSLPTCHCIVWHSLFIVEERTERRQRNELPFFHGEGRLKEQF